MNIERFRYKAWFNFAEMIELKGFYFDNLLSGQEIICIMAKDDDCTYEGILGEDCILVACTGLRDSAGRLIWEGDIVEASKRKLRGVVEWSEWEWNITAESHNSPYNPFYNYGEMICGWDELKVLGNIYEHGHLLTQHKSTGKEGEG